MSDPLTERLSVGHNYFVANYPPFQAWGPHAIADIHAALAAPPVLGTPLGVYLHVPFCRKRCRFCYYKVYTERPASEVSRYVDALHTELRMHAESAAISGRSADFVYFGGGTPSYLSGDELRRLATGMQAILPWSHDAEITFECEPGTLRWPKIEAIRDIGVTRVSLGVENFDQDILESNGRAHGERHIEPAFEMCRRAGFSQVNIDLISGMLGETDENWSRCIERTLALEPDSVTIYQMEVPGNTTLYKDIQAGNMGTDDLASWEQKRAWVDQAFSRLAAAGYHLSSGYTAVRKEGTSFGYRDNLWHGADLLGVGVSAFGHIGGVHLQNDKHLESYLTSIESGELALQRGHALTTEQRMIREWILQCKLGQVSFAYFIDKFGIDPRERFGAALQELYSAGLAEDDDHHLRLTRKGLLRVDTILPIFFEPQYAQSVGG
jgi:oxygen-independent coproporphyrinogen-3 oxidase